MRSRFHATVAAALALAVALPLSTGALAQGTQQAPGQKAPAQTAPAQAAPAQPAVPKSMPASPMAKIPFSVHPFPLTDDGTYLDFMNRVVGETGRRCVKQEQYGWEFPEKNQAALDKLYQDTLSTMEKNGYRVSKLTAKTITDPETAAYYATKDKLQLLMVWVPMQDAALLLMCQSEAGKAKK